MSKNVIELTPKQQQAVRALLLQPDIQAAAQAAGVTDRTIYRWLDEPDFRKVLTDAESKVIDAAARGLVRMVGKALATIEGTLDNPALHPATRLRAAGLVIDNALKLVELRNFDQRLAALEAQQDDE